MTTREHNTLQNFINQISELNKTADDAFHFLQMKNKEINGNAWCCAAINHKELLAAGYDYTYKYDQYVKANAKRDMLTDLGKELADLNFWK